MTMIPQGRWGTVSAGLCLAALALLGCPAAAQSPESPGAAAATKPRPAEGWKQRGRPDAVAETSAEKGAEPANEPAAEPPATKSDATKSDATKSDATKAVAAPPAKKPSVALPKPGASANGVGTAERRSFTSGSGDRSLAAEKAAVDGVTTKTSVDELLARALPRRSDRPGDWTAGAEPLHQCGEPRWIEPCIPLPPCHPSHPPHPYDLVGVAGDPTCGPIYRGPCCPRTGSHDDGPHPRLDRVSDRFFDAFYRTK